MNKFGEFLAIEILVRNAHRSEKPKTESSAVNGFVSSYLESFWTVLSLSKHFLVEMA